MPHSHATHLVAPLLLGVVLVLAVPAAGCLDRGAVVCASGLLCPNGSTCDEEHLVCLRPGETRCASGQLCPPGKRCEDVTDRCVDEGVTVCGDGLQELGEECDAGADNDDDRPDACRRDCRRAGCGDAVLDTAEVCDDGNREDADGCSSDCRSDETCGNGVVDALFGEGCDDGNLRSRDGCSSGCQPELPLWEPLQGKVRPPPRSRAFATWAEAARRLIMVGGEGQDGALLGDTWSWDGFGWAQRESQPLVVERRDGALSMDEARGLPVMVVCGGSPCWAWELSEAGWNAMEADEGPVGRPPPRQRFGLAFDPASQSLILFGGAAADGTARADTWRLDGNGWQLMVDAGGPVGVTGPVLATDHGRSRVVLAGIVSGAQPWRTWELVDGVWQARFPSGVPLSGSTTFSGELRALPGFGGVGIQLWHEDDVTQSWRYDGAAWTQRTTIQGGMPVEDGSAMAFDRKGDRVLAFGGREDSTLPNDRIYAVVGDAESWLALPSVGLPSDRTRGAMAFDPAGQRTLVFGGVLANGAVERTWAFRAGAWSLLGADAPTPGWRLGAAMTWDGVAARVVLHGGQTAQGANDDTLADGDLWALGEATWAPVGTAGGPRLSDHGLIFDARRGRLVAHGAPTPPAAGSTWEVVDGAWTAVTTATDPGVRRGQALAWDPLREVTVRFGGRDDAGAAHADTWEYDGEDWRRIAVYRTPSPRIDAALAWNEARGRLVLHGGRAGGGGQPLDDTWEYDGRTWIRLATAAPGPAVAEHAMAWDAVERAILLVGDAAGGACWTYAVRGSGEDEWCDDPGDWDGDGLAACDDPDCNGAPSCPVRERCRDGGDDDGDGLIDCGDPNCGGLPCAGRGEVCLAGRCACPGPANEVSCDDGIDDDCDDLFDCADPDCEARCGGCGNGTCGVGEDAETCPEDCVVCGDAMCSPGEDVASCAVDCPCGDGVCGLGETTVLCPADCAVACGDGVCSPGETDCLADCGAVCGNGVCEDGEGGEHWDTCPDDCSLWCGDGVCEGEEAFFCPEDCEAGCGDGLCAPDELATCPEDCAAGGDCGDGVCQWGETRAGCPADCASPGCVAQEDVKPFPASAETCPEGSWCGPGWSGDELAAACLPSGELPAFAPCDSQAVCEPGAACVGGYCAPLCKGAAGCEWGKCLPAKLPDGVADHYELLVCRVPPHSCAEAACELEQQICTEVAEGLVCLAPGDGDVGAWCALTYDCQGGLRCLAGRCRAPCWDSMQCGADEECVDVPHPELAAGKDGACLPAKCKAYGQPCYTGLVCRPLDAPHPDTEICVPPGPLDPGAPCLRHHDCGLGAWCLDGRCELGEGP